MPPEIYNAAIRYKAGLARRETAIMRDMAGNWLGIIRSLEGDMEDVARRMAQRRAQGLGVTVGQLYRTERYAQLLQQAYKELGKYEAYAADYIAANQDVFAKLGQQNALSLLGIIEPGIAGSFNRLNIRATQTIAGFAASGSPLRRLLAEAWPHAIDQTTQALVRGVGAGYGPKRIARMMSQGLSAGFRRSLVIARTETLRAYRVSTMEAWRETGYVIGFQRVATHDRRTCPACLFSEGAFIPFEEDFAEHPQGRCVAIPVTRRSGMAKWEYGPEWFERQPEATQIAILGKGRHTAWKAGLFDLYDIPQQIPNATWGNGMRARSLTELLVDARGGSQRDRWLRTIEPFKAPQVPTVDYLAASLDEMRTVPDIEKWMNARFPNVRFDFTDAHMDTVLPSLRQLEKLGRQYPEVMKRLEYVGTYRGVGAPKGSFSGEFAHAYNDGTKLGFNPGYYGNPDRLRQSLRDCLARGWLDADGSIESVMTHEFGHMVENWLLSSSKAFSKYSMASGLGDVRETVRLFNGKFKPTKKLSAYAVTTNSTRTSSSATSVANKAEGWAEAFSAIHHKPKKEWVAYVKRLNTLIETVSDTSTWQDPVYMGLLPFGSEERQRAKEVLDKLRKKLGL